MGDPLGAGAPTLQEAPPSSYRDSFPSPGSFPGCFSHPSHSNPFGTSALSQLEDHDTGVNVGTLTPNPPFAFSSRAKSHWRWQKPIFSCQHDSSSVPRCSGFRMNTVTCLPPCLDSPCRCIPPHPGVPEGTLPWGARGHRAGRREESSQGLVIQLDQAVLFGSSTCRFSLWKCPWTRGICQVPAAPQAPVRCPGDSG